MGDWVGHSAAVIGDWVGHSAAVIGDWVGRSAAVIGVLKKCLFPHRHSNSIPCNP